MKRNARLILHIDLDAFFCSVEELLDPSLKSKAFAVGGPAESRGVISTASYAARKFGIHSALPTKRAFQLLPTLLLLPSHYEAYSEYSRRVMDILADTAPDVEPLSIDEAFLDCEGDPRPGEVLGAALKERIRADTGLASTVGIASNKLVAKIATNQAKPDGLLVIPPGGEAAFLAPLPVRELWGIGPKTQAQLEKVGIRTVGDLAGWPEADLARRFGQSGRAMADRARGVDDDPVAGGHEAKSVSKETTFARDVTDETELRVTLRALADDVAATLREEGLEAQTVRLKIRWPPFETRLRQIHLAQSTCLGEDIFRHAWSLFQEMWSPGKPVRLIGVGTSQLSAGSGQLPLFADGAREETLRLEKAVDRIRERFGEEVVGRASLLKKKPPA